MDSVVFFSGPAKISAIAYETVENKRHSRLKEHIAVKQVPGSLS